MELFKHSPIHGGVPGRDFDGLQAEVAMELAEYQLQKHERKPWHSTTGDIDQSKCFCYFVQSLIFMLFQIAGLPEDEIVNGVRGYYQEVLKVPVTRYDVEPVPPPGGTIRVITPQGKLVQIRRLPRRVSSFMSQADTTATLPSRSLSIS